MKIVEFISISCALITCVMIGICIGYLIGVAR